MKILDLKNSNESCGGKAYGLAKLINCNINVPKGFVILESQKMIEKDKNEISKYLEQFDKTTKLAIRSSASEEDGKIKSFAGVFETVLNVKNDVDDVWNAIKYVNNSAISSIVENYSNDKAKMNIVVQEMVNSKISGVCFTNAIDVDGNKCALFEYVEGVGEKLVSGKSNSNRIIVRYNDNKLCYEHAILNGKLINFDGFVEICKLIQKAIDEYNDCLDIEWSIDQNGVAYLLQARPITKTVFIENNNKSNLTNTIVASKGYVEAETYVINADLSYEEVQEEIKKFPDNCILVCDYTETYYLPAMKKARGIITNTGSSLCHAAIVSRELEIPCIVGYTGATELFPTGTRIKLDANNNLISLVDSNSKIEISQNYKLDFGQLDCFDNIIDITIDDIKMFIEFTLDGIYVHKPDNINSSIIEKVEKLVRTNFQQIPNYSTDENKYLWIKEIKRFKKLPFFNKYYDEIKECSMSFDIKKLKNVQSELFDIAKKSLAIKNNSNDIILNSFIDEIIASINELLDGIIPFGYPIYEAYVQSLQLLDEEGIKYNDLFTKVKIKNSKLRKIQKFLSIVSKIKDESYQIIWDMGGTDPDYFEHRDSNIENILFQNKILINDEVMNVFYEKYSDEYFKILMEKILK